MHASSALAGCFLLAALVKTLYEPDYGLAHRVNNTMDSLQKLLPIIRAAELHAQIYGQQTVSPHNLFYPKKFELPWRKNSKALGRIFDATITQAQEMRENLLNVRSSFAFTDYGPRAKSDSGTYALAVLMPYLDKEIETLSELLKSERVHIDELGLKYARDWKRLVPNDTESSANSSWIGDERRKLKSSDQNFSYSPAALSEVAPALTGSSMPLGAPPHPAPVPKELSREEILAQPNKNKVRILRDPKLRDTRGMHYDMDTTERAAADTPQVSDHPVSAARREELRREKDKDRQVDQNAPNR